MASAQSDELLAVAQRIAEALPPDVEEAVVTGSVSRGAADDVSDEQDVDGLDHDLCPLILPSTCGSGFLADHWSGHRPRPTSLRSRRP